MSRKKFFYLSAVSFLLLGVFGSSLLTLFLGIEHVSTLLLVGLVWTLFGVPAMGCFLLALFAHSAEPFVGRETSFSSAFIAALGFIGIVMLLFHFAYLWTY